MGNIGEVSINEGVERSAFWFTHATTPQGFVRMCSFIFMYGYTLVNMYLPMTLFVSVQALVKAKLPNDDFQGMKEGPPSWTY